MSVKTIGLDKLSGLCVSDTQFPEIGGLVSCGLRHLAHETSAREIHSRFLHTFVKLLLRNQAGGELAF